MEFPINEVEIRNVFINDTNKAGEPFVTKPSKNSEGGKPFKKINFLVNSDTIDEVGFEGKLSILVFQNNDKTFDLDMWVEGTKISGNIVQNGDWWNFEIPKADPVAQAAKIAELEAALAAKDGEEEMRPGETKVEEEDKLSDEDLPF